MINRKPIITLLTDFGLKDPYVAEMKAVILSICPETIIVDICHEVSKFDVRSGAFILAQATPNFPYGTIHVAVVDPGVGTKRKPIIINTKRSTYVGPDNGLLMLAAQKEGIRRIHEIINPEYMLYESSSTFHGRDIFSPVAAYLAKGTHSTKLGPEIRNPSTLSFARPNIRENTVVGEILYIDSFGNIITNITKEELTAVGVEEGRNLTIKITDNELIVQHCNTYEAVQPDSLLALVGGSGFLELSVNQGNAAERLKVKIRNKITIVP